MGRTVDATRLETLQEELLGPVWGWLQEHLKLMMLKQSVRVLSEATIGRPP
jgi:hypothetical protein